MLTPGIRQSYARCHYHTVLCSWFGTVIAVVREKVRFRHHGQPISDE